MRLIDCDKLCEDLLDRWHTADVHKEEMIRAVLADVVTPIIACQPTVNQWIPVSERLPEKSGWYLCSYESKLVQSTLFYDGGWLIVNVDVNNVLAWCELPEPYKEATK